MTAPSSPSPVEGTQNPVLEIAHVLFLDMVSYSKLPTDEQPRLLGELQEVVRDTREYLRAVEENRVIQLPTGDGMALVFFGSPEAPAQCAIEISRKLKAHPDIRLRMGIHTGPVFRVKDINANMNVPGGGINVAQRVMGCGDGGHILVSGAFADVLRQMSAWKDSLHDLGNIRVKHGQKIRIFNLYSTEFGNAERPQKVRGARIRTLAVAVLLLLAFAVLSTYLLLRGPTVEESKLSQWGKAVGSASISSDGSLVAFDSDATGEKEIYILQMKSAEISKRTQGAGDKSDPRFSPDGASILYVVCAETCNIWTMPTLGGDAKPLVAHASGADWSPDAKRLIYARELSGEPASLWVRDLDSGTEKEVYQSNFEEITCVRWSPEGQWVFFYDGGGPRLIKPDIGPASVTALRSDAGLGERDDVAWSRDARHLYWSMPQKGLGVIWRLAVPDGRPERVFAGPGDYSCPLPSPAENAIVYSHGSQYSTLLAKEANRGEPNELANGGLISDPSISPDGTRVAFIQEIEGNRGGQRIKVVTMEGAEVASLPVAGQDGKYPIWSPDSTHIAYSALVGETDHEYYQIFSGPFGGPRFEQLTTGDVDNYCDDWSPDGKSILLTQSLRGKEALATVGLGGGRRIIADNFDDAAYCWGDWLIAVGPTDLPERKGLWLIDSRGTATNRILLDPVTKAKCVQNGHAIVYTLTRKVRRRVTLWKLPIAQLRPSGKSAAYVVFPLAGGKEEWDADEKLSSIVFVRVENRSDFFKRSPLK